MTSPSIKEALEPCPFCNTAPAFGRMIEPDQVTIGCNNDGCLVQLCVVSDVESEAVKAWNTRATLQPSGEMREAIARITFEHEWERPWSDAQPYEREHHLSGADKFIASGLLQDEAASDGLRKALIKRAYAMSESHLSGYRLTIGFENLEDMQAAHMALPIRSARNGGAS